MLFYCNHACEYVCICRYMNMLYSAFGKVRCLYPDFFYFLLIIFTILISIKNCVSLVKFEAADSLGKMKKLAQLYFFFNPVLCYFNLTIIIFITLTSHYYLTQTFPKNSLLLSISLSVLPARPFSFFKAWSQFI